MGEYKLKWKRLFDNCESESNIVIDKDGNVIFYYNQFVDAILKERKLGKLWSLNPQGEDNWEFSFPDYNYLYFTGRIVPAKNNDSLYVTADSNQTYDSGYERGLYEFNINGNFTKHYLYDEMKSIPQIIGLVPNRNNEEALRLELKKLAGGEIGEIAVYENNIYGFSACKHCLKLICIEIDLLQSLENEKSE